MDIILTPVLFATFIKYAVDAIKVVPKIPKWALPFIAMGLGGAIWPFAVGGFTGVAVVTGLVIGSGAVGAHEAIKNVTEAVKA